MTPMAVILHGAGMKLLSTHDVVIVERIRLARDPFYRPALPAHESDSLQPGMLTMMKQCWAEEPNDRPSFDDVAKALRTINKGK